MAPGSEVFHARRELSDEVNAAFAGLAPIQALM
jgi:hypothetical protein